MDASAAAAAAVAAAAAAAVSCHWDVKAPPDTPPSGVCLWDWAGLASVSWFDRRRRNNRPPTATECRRRQLVSAILKSTTSWCAVASRSLVVRLYSADRSNYLAYHHGYGGVCKPPHASRCRTKWVSRLALLLPSRLIIIIFIHQINDRHRPKEKTHKKL